MFSKLPDGFVMLLDFASGSSSAITGFRVTTHGKLNRPTSFVSDE